MASLTTIQTNLDTDIALESAGGPTDLLLLPGGRDTQTFARTIDFGRLRWLLPVTDLLAANVAIVAVFLATGPMPAPVGVLLAPAWCVLLWGAGSYAAHPISLSRGAHAKRVLNAAALVGLGCWVATTVALLPERPWMLLLLTAAVTTATLLAREVVGQVADRTSQPIRIVVAGESRQVSRTVAELRRTKRRRYDVVSVCVATHDPEVEFDVPVRVGLEQVGSAAADSSAAAVVVLPYEELDARSVQRLGWDFENTPTQLYLGTPLLDVGFSRTSLVSAAGLRMLQVRSAPRRGVGGWVKEVGERAIALIALVVLMPALAVIALLVRRDSAGPAVFRQERIGRGGRAFTMYKFRTMRTDAEAVIHELLESNEADGLLFKVRQDPRITRLGAILRRYSLDELPQLVNVVTGQMSLVGPRPALPEEVRQYGQDPSRRLAVKPGLTGLWQVSGRSDLSWEDSVRLDLAYVDNWSLLLDLHIACRTLGAVLGHRGAY